MEVSNRAHLSCFCVAGLRRAVGDLLLIIPIRQSPGCREKCRAGRAQGGRGREGYGSSKLQSARLTSRGRPPTELCVSISIHPRFCRLSLDHFPPQS